MSAFGAEVMTVPLCQRICSVFYVHLNEKEKLKDRKKFKSTFSKYCITKKVVCKPSFFLNPPNLCNACAILQVCVKGNVP